MVLLLSKGDFIACTNYYFQNVDELLIHALFCSPSFGSPLDAFSRLHSSFTKDLETQYCALYTMSHLQSVMLFTSDKFFVLESSYHIQPIE